MLENIVNGLITKVKRISSALVLTAAIGVSSLLPNLEIDHNQNIPQPTISYSTAEAGSRKRLRIKRIKDKDLPERMVYDKKKSRKERIHVYRYKLPTYKEDSKDNTEADFLYMVFVPKGLFIMGHKDVKDNPPHRVYLDSYFIGMYETTNEQFKKFIDETNYKPTPKNWENNEYPKGKEKFPVCGISPKDVLSFCKWAGLELPTEAQWEKAARGPYPDQRKYPWGDQPSLPNEKYANIPPSADELKPTEIRKYKLGHSPYGCYNLVGNVREICGDKYNEFDKSQFNRIIKNPKYIEGEGYVFKGHFYMSCISRRITKGIPLSYQDPLSGFRPILNYSNNSILL